MAVVVEVVDKDRLFLAESSGKEEEKEKKS